MFALSGVLSIIGNPTTGRLLDRFGPKVILQYHAIVLVVAYAFVFAGVFTGYNLYFFFVASAMFGLTDAVNTTFLGAMLLKDMKGEIAGGLAGTTLF